MHVGNYLGLQIIVLSDLNQTDEIRALAAKHCGEERHVRPLSKVEGFIGETAKVMLLIIDGGCHAEGITVFNKEVAGACRGSNEFLGVDVSSKWHERSPSETVVIFELRANDIDGFEQFLGVPSMRGIVRCVASPVQYEVRVICRGDAVDPLCRDIYGEQITSPRTATIFKHVWTEQPRTVRHDRGRRRQYDVIWAQINETTINAVAYLSERVARLEGHIATGAPGSRGLIDLRLPLATFRKNLEMLLADAHSSKERAVKLKVSGAGTVDVISNYVRHAENQVSVLEEFLEQRGTGSESLPRGQMRADGAIMALDGVAHFCGRAIEHTQEVAPAERRQWAVLLGRQVTFMDAPEFSGVLPINTSWTAPGAVFRISGAGARPQGARVGIVEFPRQWKLRCGSYLLIAWAVTGDYGSGGWGNEAIAELEAEVESEDASLRKESGAASNLTVDGTHELAERLFHDLIAISMMGPAYVYALARFGLLGRTGSMDWKGLAKYVVGEELVRLRLDLRMLNSLGLKVPFFTDMFDPVRKGLSSPKLKGLLERQGRLVQERYEFSVCKVMPDLIAGKVEGWAPDLVLNALWRGVAERRKYVNEAAVFWSLMRWGANRPEAELPKRGGGVA